MSKPNGNPDCPRAEMPVFNGDDAAVAVSRTLSANPCVNQASGSANFSSSIKGEVGITGGSLDGKASGESEFSVSSSGCDAIGQIADSFKSSHDQLSCVINDVKQTSSTSVVLAQEVIFRCSFCDNVRFVGNQTIEANCVANGQLSDTASVKMKQIVNNFIEDTGKIINESKTELGSLASGAKSGASLDSVIQDTQAEIAKRGLVQKISAKFLETQKATFDLTYSKNVDIEINQALSTQILATNIMSSSLAVLMSQFTTTSVKRAFSLENRKEDTGLATLVGAFGALWMVPMLIGLGLIIAISVMGKKAGGLSSAGGGPKKMAMTLIVVAVIMFFVAILFAVWGWWEAFGVVLALSLILGGLGGYFFHKTKNNGK